jgi:hypothetical protein
VDAAQMVRGAEADEVLGRVGAAGGAELDVVRVDRGATAAGHLTAPAIAA